eukprot:FR744146.1.p1 GENE.FR744146.1~~FR744146.1.p1  ORF type:complete len:393 (+),score=123.71 FR744146.1:74-1180(+)
MMSTAPRSPVDVWSNRATVAEPPPRTLRQEADEVSAEAQRLRQEADRVSVEAQRLQEALKTESADEIAHRALREIDRYLSLRNMKTLDLFKMRSINTSACVGDGGDMLLSSDELIQLLKHTQVRLTRSEVESVIQFLDKDGNGELDIAELDVALRNARKKMRNIPTDAMTIALRANTAQMGSRFGGERRDELRDLRRKYLPRMIQNRYYTKPAGGHMIRPAPPKPQQLGGIWQYNRSPLDQSWTTNEHWGAARRSPSRYFRLKKIPNKKKKKKKKKKSGRRGGTAKGPNPGEPPISKAGPPPRGKPPLFVPFNGGFNCPPFGGIPGVKTFFPWWEKFVFPAPQFSPPTQSKTRENNKKVEKSPRGGAP